jgi:hypothetical protein
MRQGGFRSVMRTPEDVSACRTLFRKAAVLLNHLEQISKVSFACRTFDLSRDTRVPASGPDEFVIESAKIDRLFICACHFACRDARSNLILDDNAQQPSVCRVCGCYLESANGCDFTQILPFLIAEVQFLPGRNFPHFPAAPRGDFERGWRSFMLSLDPPHDLRRIDIDRIALHAGS